MHSFVQAALVSSYISQPETLQVGKKMMIGLEDVYKVFAAVVPIYVALLLGYGSVKWWRVFTSEQCDGINHMVCYFILPLFAFEFTAVHANLLEMNYSAIAADAISKLVTILVLALSAKCSAESNFGWCITAFSLCTLTNVLVVGIPIMRAMYGQIGVDLTVQFSVLQSIIWFPLLLCLFEIHKMRTEFTPKSRIVDGAVAAGKDTEAMADQDAMEAAENVRRPSLRAVIKVVGLKLAFNPNVYACVLGVAWAIIAQRFKVKMPGIVEGSVQILSRAGLGTAMFNLGIFVAMQRSVIACGMRMTILGMILRFIAGPALMGIGALTVGLRGDVLRICIMLATLPQSITTFVFAKEYGVHVSVLSTAVVFGTLVSLPLLIGYYAALEAI